MKNYFTKAIVAAGVVASAMALSGVAVFAATTTDLAKNVTAWPHDDTQTASMTANPFITANTEIGKEYKLKSSDKDEYSSGVAAGTTALSKNGTFSTSCQINTSGFNLASGGTNVAQFKTPTDQSCTISIQETNGKMFYLCYGDTVVEIPGGKTTETDEIPKDTLVTLVGSTKGTGKIPVITVKKVSTEPELTLSTGELKIEQGYKKTFGVTLKNSDATIVPSCTTEGVDVSYDADKKLVTVNVAATAAVGEATVTVNAGELSEKVTVTITKSIERIAVEPKTNGTTTTYAFNDSSYVGKRLVEDTKGDKTATTAYSVYADDVSVDFVADGAKLADESTAAAATLVVPSSKVTAGKVTVKGTVIPTTGNTGSKWALVNMSGLYVCSNSSKKLELSADTSSDGNTTAGAVTKDSTIEYNVEIDLDNGTASGTIKNGTADAVEFSNVKLPTGYSFSYVSFTTNGSGAGSGARTLVIPSVEYTVEANVEFLAGTVDTKAAIAKVNDQYYAILPISENTAKEKTSLKLAGQEAEAIYEAVQVTGLSKSAAADFDSGAAYVYGIEVVPATSGTTTEPTLAQVQAAVTVAFS